MKNFSFVSRVSFRYSRDKYLNLSAIDKRLKRISFLPEEKNPIFLTILSLASIASAHRDFPRPHNNAFCTQLKCQNDNFTRCHFYSRRCAGPPGIPARIFIIPSEVAFRAFGIPASLALLLFRRIVSFLFHAGFTDFSVITQIVQYVGKTFQDRGRRMAATVRDSFIHDPFIQRSFITVLQPFL